MKMKPLFVLALLTLLAGGCASDPGFNLLPPPIYQRGSLEAPTAKQVASVEPLAPMEAGESHTSATAGAFSRQVTPF